MKPICVYWILEYWATKVKKIDIPLPKDEEVLIKSFTIAGCLTDWF